MRNFVPASLFVFLLSLFLASCASVGEKPVAVPEVKIPELSKKKKTEPDNWAEEKRKRQQLSKWEIRGRLGIQTETNGGTMDIIWKQADNEYSIRLIAAMGAGTYLIQGDEQFAEIRFPDGDKRIIDDVDDVFSTALELDLPVSAVQDWVRGLPAEKLSAGKIKWNKQGLIDSIEQSGWRVEMKKYAGSGVAMPHDLHLTHNDDDDVSIRFLFRQWLIDN